jgi:HSP20 family molecular chaperone IbpA
MAENQELQRDDIRTESARGVTLSPRVDILETDDEMRLVAELPGVKSEDVDIRFENGELTIHGRRTPSHQGLQRTHWEYDVTNYFRSFRVNERIAADKIHAELKNGLLTVHLPKTESARPRRIAVKG